MGAGEKLKVVATTSIVADVVRNVGGDMIDLTVLLPIGTDPHAFEPTPRDLVSVADAHVVFINGLGLEAFLDEMLENAGGEGQEINTKRIVTDFYTAHPDMTHMVVCTNNDEGGLGALSAIETMGKEDNFFIVSHGGDTPFHEKMRAGKGDVWIGSVAYMPERYGEFMIPWLMDILDGKDVPREMSPEHFVLTADNLDQYYPE